ncbi:MAG: LuxR C-terminal-related transcriptional regulator [Gemmatimonadota bacterium]
MPGSSGAVEVRRPSARVEAPSVRVIQLAPPIRALFDSLEERILVWQPPSGTTFPNAMLREFLAAVPDSPSLLAALCSVAEAVWAESRPRLLSGGRTDLRPTGSFTQEFTVQSRRFLCRGRMLSPDPLWSSGLVLIALQAETRREPCALEMRHRYGLTARETEVAMLLANGCSNTNVATELHVSRHTARRHTERVLAKLQVSSRAKVGVLFRTG